MKVGRRAQKSVQAGTINWESNLPGLTFLLCSVAISLASLRALIYMYFQIDLIDHEPFLALVAIHI